MDSSHDDEDSPRTRAARRRSLPAVATRKKSSRVSARNSPEASNKSEGGVSPPAASGGSKSSTKLQKSTAAKAPPESKPSEEKVSPQEDLSINESKSSFEHMENVEDPLETNQVLDAVLPNGKAVTIRLIVNNETPYDDGNNFYCEVCNDTGEIVCCDGCPKAFHQVCIPQGSPSRLALDNDADPWYCPDCIVQQQESSSRRATKRMCSECRQSTGDSPLVPCEQCGVYLHHPSCVPQDGMDEEMDEDLPVLCSNCTAGEVVSQEQNELGLEAHDEDEPRRPRRRASIDTVSMDDDDDDEMSDGHNRSKRKRSVDDSVEKSTAKQRDDDQSSVKKRKKKKKRRSQSMGDDSREGDSCSPVGHDRPFLRTAPAPRGLVRATPAFFFFVNDHRYKVERALARKHRYFARLPKGAERNQLIAREAAVWWVKLRPSEHRRYLNISMRDFEERVIAWKEEKTEREMMGGSQDADDAEYGVEEGDQAKKLTPEDEKLAYEQHQKLYVDSSVGSKPFVPEPGESNNRLLLEVLQDMRFHPVPMLKADRTDEEPGQMEYSKVSIPYFEVHGPVATSVGDECVGCTRGWTHFCPVLKRRIPAIENRAKLQPPLSSLMATRVGLGLRPRLQKVEKEDWEAADEEWRKADSFSERETSASKEVRQLPPILSYALTEPSTRGDDIANFVEGAVAMKIPEPPRPSVQESSRRAMLSRGALPMHGRKNRERGPDSGNWKCGRCRTVIQTDTGCVQCRRAQLVINMSKQQSTRSGEGLLNVQTGMLSRLTTKHSNYDEQSEEDKRVADMMLKMRWSPSAIMPPRNILAPEHIPGSSDVAESSSDGQDSTDEDTIMDTSVEVPIASVLTDDSGANALDAIDEETSENSDVRMLTSNETEGKEDAGEERSSRRKRARREPAFSTAAVEKAENDRRQIARELHEETSQLNKRCVTVASSGILLAMLRRDPLLLFAEPVPADVEAYTKIVPNPIDFGKIKAKVLNEEYKTLAAFISDARRLCTNALAYNPVGTIYNKTAKELLDVLEVMQKRAHDWTNAVKNAHTSSFAWRRPGSSSGPLVFDQDGSGKKDDPFRELRQSWPEAVDVLESGDWFKSQVGADFVRTRENENAYYGSLAVRRAAAAAEASLASYPDSGGAHSSVIRRSHTEDEALRSLIDNHVAEVAKPVELKDVPTWREDSIIKMLRRVQTRRIEGRIASCNGSARCDGVRVEQEAKISMTAEAVRFGKYKRKPVSDSIPRVAESRISLSTGLGSSNSREAMEKRQTEADLPEKVEDCIGEVGISVHGSPIHGWGLFADQPFKAGDIVAEYVGEYASPASADAREKMYQDKRIQDYQFRADELVIDATAKGGCGRFINHNCSPNCVAKIVEGKSPNRHLKRVMIIAQSKIKPREEITYDYQFPLELDLDARIPCNCGSSSCRGFMNWDLPEKGSKNRPKRGSKRGGNMRDRIRRLNRPRKRDGTDS